MEMRYMLLCVVDMMRCLALRCVIDTSRCATCVCAVALLLCVVDRIRSVTLHRPCCEFSVTAVTGRSSVSRKRQVCFKLQLFFSGFSHHLWSTEWFSISFFHSVLSSGSIYTLSISLLHKFFTWFFLCSSPSPFWY